MALNKFVNIEEFWSMKSIKLSDAFEVYIKLDDKEAKPYANCTGVTIPKLEFSEETLEYGNLSQIFLTPNYNSCKELSLDFLEHMVGNNLSYSLSQVFKYMDFNLTQKYSNGLMVNTASYDIDKMIPSIDIKIMDNKLHKFIYKYHFGNLKIVNYSMYNLDHQSYSTMKITVMFSFETFDKGPINEKIIYETPKVKKEKKVVKKTEIENWKESINESDLKEISNQPITRPELNELPEIEDIIGSDSIPASNIGGYKNGLTMDRGAQGTEQTRINSLRGR